MSRIRIKNFGPIKEGCLENDGWIDVKKVTVFIGNQGSGKSTVAKVFSTMSWIEKAINRGDVDTRKLSILVFMQHFEYQRIINYFRDDTIIEYEGDSARIKYNGKMDWPDVQTLKKSNFNMPKIMYVPAERNFLSVVKNPYGIKNLPDTLRTFAEELRKGQLELNGKLLQLPISELKYKYNKENETSYIVGENFELDLLESSSGFQSFVPLYLVTKFLSDELQKGENLLREQLNVDQSTTVPVTTTTTTTIFREQLNVEQSVRRNMEVNEIMFNNALTDTEKKSKVKEIDSKYLNTCFINIVEEPEQNLFPSSQQKILNSLLAFNNMNENNKLVMTTHSPYLINYLTLAVKAFKVYANLENEESKEKINEIVPINSFIDPSELIIYQLDEKDGIIARLNDYKGLPSDENYLNDSLAETNQQFAQLQEIEKGWR
jgi:predicted ATPase